MSLLRETKLMKQSNPPQCVSIGRKNQEYQTPRKQISDISYLKKREGGGKNDTVQKRRFKKKKKKGEKGTGNQLTESEPGEPSFNLDLGIGLGSFLEPGLLSHPFLAESKLILLDSKPLIFPLFKESLLVFESSFTFVL